MSIESVRVVPASTLPGSGMTPASNSSRSVRLVLPASTCARIPRLRVRNGQLLQESGRDWWQGSCRTHHGYLLDKPSADNPLPPSPASLRNPFSASEIPGNTGANQPASIRRQSHRQDRQNQGFTGTHETAPQGTTTRLTRVLTITPIGRYLGECGPDHTTSS